MSLILDVWFASKPTLEQARKSARELECTIRTRYPGDRHDTPAEQAKRDAFEAASLELDEQLACRRL